MDKDNKKFIIETIFLKEAIKMNLSLKEFIVLMYFDNMYGEYFDVKNISKATCLNEQDVLTAFGGLLDKKLIILNSEKDENGKLVDHVSLDNLYNKIKNNEKKKKANDDKKNLFAKFQAEYGRSLSGMDFECINGWLDSGFSEELIIGAVKEASYNGVSSLRYIDTILFEWKKKGLTKMSEVNSYIKKREESKTELIEDNVLEYNWLDDE